MFFGYRKEENSTIVALLAGAMRRDISFGLLEPDARLRLDVLTQRYGGSKHSLREALRILSTEGLVEAEAQRGFRVTSATEADLQDVMRIRLQIERMALSWSIEHGKFDWEAAVVAAHHGLRRREEAVAADLDDLKALEWDEATRAFHVALASASQSSRIIALQQQFFDQSRRFLLALLREGRLDFAARASRQERLVASLIRRDLAESLAALEAVILGDFAGRNF